MPSSRLAQAPLPETTDNTLDFELIANQFTEIMKLLGGGKSQTFTDTEKNYAKDVCEWLDSFISFIGNKSRRMEVIAFFESFETTTQIKRSDIIQFIEMVNALEDIDEVEHGIIDNNEPRKWRKVEMLRAIFAAFGLLHTETIAGVKKIPSNPLINLFSNYVESSGQYHGRLYIESNILRYFEPDEDMKGAIFTKLKKEVTQVSTPLTLIISQEIPGEVVTILDKSGVEPGENFPKELGEVGESDQTGAVERESAPKSDAKKGRYNRRSRDREIKAEKIDSIIERLDQEWYSTELERLKSLRAFLHERFEELRAHLIANIPYVGEVLDYLSVIGKLKEKGYEVESLDVNEVRRDFARLIDDYRRLLSGKKTANIKYAQDKAGLSDQVTNAPESEQQKLLRRIKKVQGKIERNLEDIRAYEAEMKSRQDESDGLFTQVEGYRLSAIPNIEQFTLGVYHSLRAEKLYSAPDFVPEIPVSEDWIDENILPLFVGILSTHLGNEDINIQNLYELMKKIDELPDDYSESLSIPETEGISQAKAGDFFAMLIPLIPKEHLAEIPNLRTIVTPEGVYAPKELVKKESKPRKTRSEKRAENSTRKASLQRSRALLIEELRTTENSLKEYLYFWKERLIQNLKTRRDYTADIEKIDRKIKLRRAFPNKSKDDLEALIEASKTEEVEIREMIASGELKTDEIEYKKLIDARAQISRKLARLK